MPCGDSSDRDKYIEEQKKIIMEQQEQIQRLANLASGNTTQGVQQKEFQLVLVSFSSL